MPRTCSSRPTPTGSGFFPLKRNIVLRAITSSRGSCESESMMLSDSPSLRYSLDGFPDAFANGSTATESMRSLPKMS